MPERPSQIILGSKPPEERRIILKGAPPEPPKRGGFLFVILLLLLGGFVGGWWLSGSRKPFSGGEEVAEAPGAFPATPVLVPSGTPLALTFPDPERHQMRTVERVVSSEFGKSRLARNLFTTWASEAGIFEAAALQHVFFSADGLLVLDFPSGGLPNLPTGATEEWLTLAPMLKTFFDAFPEINRIQVTVEGKEVVLPAGRLDWSRPVGRGMFR